MRLIDVDALLKKSVKLHSLDEAEVVYTHNILIAPVIDAVEVVRCGECKDFYCCDAAAHRYYCRNLWGLKHIDTPDSHCSYGKRRESEEPK